ncbi:MAG: shikimate dehydrogenase [Rhodospirillales bacterium]|nr:shikimate dehydrogenase [Rhodospirillales bacterium]
MPSCRPVVCGSIAGRPGRFGVAMHTAAYRALGLDYVYVAFGTEDTAGAMAAMRALGIRGLGVTMPHKLRIAAFLDALTDEARAIGAVNTVVNDDGRLTGHNVDWIGALRAFREVFEPAGRTAAVVGAGGGARAIAWGLKHAGCTVSVFNRNEAAGRALALQMGGEFAGAPAALATMPETTQPFDLIAHATPVGFHDPTSSLIPPTALRPQTIVFDAVPMPIRTKLLCDAEAAGCRTIPGLRMQLHQAACQFELYTGRTPDLAILERALCTAMAETT